MAGWLPTAGLWLVIELNLAVPLAIQTVVRTLGADVVRSDQDPLTGVLNRRAFYERATTLLTSPGDDLHLIVVMIDLDKFKKLNDAYGHLAGDQALTAVGWVLRETSNSSAIIGRFGGEEFIVIDAVPAELAERLPTQLCTAIAALPHPVTASVGAAVVRWGSGSAMDDLIRSADAAMYAAKRAGGNQIADLPARPGRGLSQHEWPMFKAVAGSSGRRLSLRTLIFCCVGVIALVFVATMAASIVGRNSVARDVQTLSDRLIPIRNQSSELSRAFVDQETGQRGYLLTGNTIALELYEVGTASANRLIPTLRHELAGLNDADELLALFDDELAAAAIWKQTDSRSADSCAAWRINFAHAARSDGSRRERCVRQTPRTVPRLQCSDRLPPRRSDCAHPLGAAGGKHQSVRCGNSARRQRHRLHHRCAAHAHAIPSPGWYALSAQWPTATTTNRSAGRSSRDRGDFRRCGRYAQPAARTCPVRQRHRLGQPRRDDGPLRCRARQPAITRGSIGSSVLRYRPLQTDQRHLGACRRRRRAVDHRGPDA